MKKGLTIYAKVSKKAKRSTNRRRGFFSKSLNILNSKRRKCRSRLA